MPLSLNIKFLLLACLVWAMDLSMAKLTIHGRGQDFSEHLSFSPCQEIQCGQAHHRIRSNERIFGGVEAKPGEFPYQVRLDVLGSFYCAGSIIDERHVLTAAHCVVGCNRKQQPYTYEASDYTVVIGELHMDVADGEQRFAVDLITAQRGFNECTNSPSRGQFNHDIALLRTKEPMSWSLTKNGYGSVNRICLPHSSEEYTAGDDVTLSGWGRTESRLWSEMPLTVELPIVSFNACRSAYKSAQGEDDNGEQIEVEMEVNEDQVCAGSENKNACSGDSGGPLARIIGGRSELVGIVSFGHGNCSLAALYPGGYTKVSHYTDWIRENL